MRIAKALAAAGINSRRKCEGYITGGEVKINGKVVRDLSTQVDLEKDEISFRQKVLQFQELIYYVMNKPKGFTTTAYDRHAKKTVFDLLPPSLGKSIQQYTGIRTRVFAVGRLDRDSTGVLLFTNDGELANNLLHPRYHIKKTYQVRLNRAFDLKDKEKLFKGIYLSEGKATIDELSVISNRNLAVTIYEGKNREVRRIFAKLDYKVIGLNRSAFGPLTLGRMPIGAGRFLKKEEIRKLKKTISEEK